MNQEIHEDRYVSIDGIRARFWSAGETGDPVLLIHGFGASVEIWQRNMATLAARHRVYALDLIGFGRTDKPPGPYSPSMMADYIDGFMKAMQIERVGLVGLSLGGAISMLYTLQHPEKVAKLVLVDSAGLGEEMVFSMRLMSLPLIGELMTRPSRKMAYLFFKPAVLDSSILKGRFTDLYFELFSLPGAQAALLKVLRSIAGIFGPKKDALSLTLSNLEKLKPPTLIIWGSEDAVLPLKQAHVGKERIPHSELRIIDRCGHMPNFEKPEVFNEIVLDFLSGRG